MIKSWNLQNFKSVGLLENMELAPLTIFAGANSSGKSTILQSILLTAQTLQNSFNEKSIILNGHISKFGSFEDILSNVAKENKITIGFVLVPNSEDPEYFRDDFPYYSFSHYGSIKNIKCGFSFSNKINGETNELLQLQPKLMESTVEVQSDDKYENGKIHLFRSKKTVRDRVKELNVSESTIAQTSSLEFDIKANTFRQHRYRYFASVEEQKPKYVGASVKHFLPQILTFVYDNVLIEKNDFIKILMLNRDQVDDDPNGIFDKYCNDEIKGFIIKTLNDIQLEYSEKAPLPKNRSNFELSKISTLIKEFNYSNYIKLSKRDFTTRTLIQKVEDSKSKILSYLRTDKVDMRLESSLMHNLDYIEFFFKNNVKYLGPLRDEPKPVYPLSLTSDPTNVGFRGENTAAVIDVNRNVIVNFIKPDDLHKQRNSEIKITSDTLINAVLIWLEYMGIADKIDSADKGKLGHELKISTPNSKELHDLTHVGVGVSQVLPILVLSLLAKQDSTLIFEQPELHLNPKVQTRLADFFFSMTLLKKQCLVETHSEYLINRLRYLVAINDNDKISSNSIIYFVEKKEGLSEYRKININKYGVIDDWPIGFFDENEETASLILRAAMDKKKRESITKK